MKRQIFFLLFFFFIAIPDLTCKWNSQGPWWITISLKWASKTVERQSERYLKSKVAPDTCNATGLWLGPEPESKVVPLHGQPRWWLNCRENHPYHGHPLGVQYKAETKWKTANAISKYLSIRGANTVIANMKRPLTVDYLFFLYTLQRLRNDRGGRPRRMVSRWICTQCEWTVP